MPKLSIKLQKDKGFLIDRFEMSYPQNLVGNDDFRNEMVFVTKELRMLGESLEKYGFDKNSINFSIKTK